MYDNDTLLKGRTSNGDHVPVAVSPEGSLKTNIPLSAFDDLLTTELTPQFQGSFEYTVTNTELGEISVTNSGTVTQADAMAVVSTGTTTGSTACWKTKRHAKYRAGLGALQRFTALFTTPVAGTYQYVGILDEVGSSADYKNGLAVGFDGTTYGYHRFSNDVKYTTAIGDWDDPLDGTGASGQTIDHTKLNIFYIKFGYLGALGPMLWFVGQDNVPYKVLTMPITGTLTEPTSHNPNYHFMICASNKATTSDLIVKNASYAYFIEGKTKYFELHQPQFSTEEQTKATVTAETVIFTIRSKGTYASKTNYIDILLELTSASIEASGANILLKLVVQTTWAR